MTQTPTAFGAVLRQLRTAAALSQEALAERAGLSPRGISDLERGTRRTPHLSTVSMLAEALNLGPEDRQALLAAARPAPLADSDQGTLPAAPLPRALTSLIGREPELVDLIALLTQATTRLVTVTGPGGAGKTRLALEAGMRLQRAFADGVVFVDLTPLRDAGLVLTTIATTLGVREQSGQPLRETLTRVLAPKTMLLLLDNCEQVLGSAPEITTLLARCPQLVVLATGREPLRVRAEQVFPVPPLPLPDPEPASELAVLERVPSVALFIERAQAAHPGFLLTPQNAASVAAICRRLDGLPLAIELAAARVRLFPPEALLTRLERSLSLLTGGARDAPARQRTLRDTIGWSYDLLSPEEQALFRRLSVFVGGWTLEATEAVTNPDGALDVLDGLGSLVERSLVRRVDEGGEEPRFGLLETIREFGLEKVTECGEEAPSRDAHAQHVLRQVDAFRHGIEGPNRARTQAQMGRELDNVRAALTWAIERQDGVTAQGIAGGLGPFWMDRGLIREGRDWIERTLALPGLSATHTPEAHYWAGWLALFQGDLARAEFHGTAALARSREARNRFGEGGGRYLLGTVAMRRGNLDQAANDFAAARHLFEKLQEPIWAYALTGVVMDSQGALALEQGNLMEAQYLFEESLAYWRSIGHLWGVPMALARMADLALRQGDSAEAVRLYAECLEGHAVLHDTFHSAWALHGMGEALLTGGRVEDAARLLGAADRLFSDMGLTLGMAASERPPVDAVRDRLRAKLGEEQFSAAWNAGRALERDAAVAQALALANSVPDWCSR